MNSDKIANQFARMGARFRIVHQETPWMRSDCALDIRNDRQGQFYCVQGGEPRRMRESSSARDRHKPRPGGNTAFEEGQPTTNQTHSKMNHSINFEGGAG